MKEELREEIQQQEAEIAHRESKARPIMAILEDSSASPLKSTSPLKYISRNVSIGIFLCPLYFLSQSPFLKLK